MSTPETSAIVWGSRRVSYTIHRSARRKKTVAVTVEPTGSVLVSLRNVSPPTDSTQL